MRSGTRRNISTTSGHKGRQGDARSRQAHREFKSGDFEPEKFEDRYENALIELLNKKRKGEPIRSAVKPRDTGNVVDLMDALRKSLNTVGKGGASQLAKDRKPKKASGQREMLMAISGKREGKSEVRAGGVPRKPNVRPVSVRPDYARILFEDSG